MRPGFGIGDAGIERVGTRDSGLVPTGTRDSGLGTRKSTQLAPLGPWARIGKKRPLPAGERNEVRGCRAAAEQRTPSQSPPARRGRDQPGLSVFGRSCCRDKDLRQVTFHGGYCRPGLCQLRFRLRCQSPTCAIHGSGARRAEAVPRLIPSRPWPVVRRLRTATGSSVLLTPSPESRRDGEADHSSQPQPELSAPARVNNP